MSLAEQLKELTRDIEVDAMPDAEQVVAEGVRRRRSRNRRRVVAGAVAAVTLGVCVALSSTSRPAAVAPAHTDRPSVASEQLRTVATVDVDAPTDAVAAGGFLWVVGGGSGVLAQVDPVRSTVVRQVALPHPGSRVAATADALWVVSSADNVVMKVDRSTLTVARTVSSGPSAQFDHPGGVTVLGTQVWVTNYGSDPSTAVAIDDETAAVSRVVILPGTRASGPVPTTFYGPVLWFLIGSRDALVRVDAQTGRLIDHPGPGESPSCGEGQLAYQQMVWSSGADPACKATTREVDATFSGDDRTYAPGLALNSVVGAGGQLWASDHANTVYRLDRETGAASVAVRLNGPLTTNRMVSADDAIWLLREQTNQLVKLTPFLAASPSGKR